MREKSATRVVNIKITNTTTLKLHEALQKDKE